MAEQFSYNFLLGRCAPSSSLKKKQVERVAGQGGSNFLLGSVQQSKKASGTDGRVGCSKLSSGVLRVQQSKEAIASDSEANSEARRKEIEMGAFLNLQREFYALCVLL